MVASSRDADMAKVSHGAPEPLLSTPFTNRSRAGTLAQTLFDRRIDTKSVWAFMASRSPDDAVTILGPTSELGWASKPALKVV